MAGITVPRYNQNQVQASNGNTGRAIEASSPDSFGLNGQTIGQGIKQAGDIYTQARESADKTMALSGDRQLSAFENDSLYGTNGAFNRKGRDAMAAIPEVTESYQKKISEVANTLTGNARSMFEQAAKERLSDVSRNLNKHGATQALAWQNSESSAYIESQQQLGVSSFMNGDSLGLNKSLERQTMTVEELAKVNGWGPEETKQKIIGVQSGTHMSVITRLADSNNDIQAKAYFEANKNMLTGDALIKAEKLVNAGNLQGESMRIADSYSAQKLSLGQQLEEARKIENPELRKQTTDQVKMNESNKRLVENAREQDINKSVASQIDRGIKWTSIPQSTRDQLSSSQRSALQSYAQERERGITPKTDWNVWTELKKMANDPGSRDKFNKLDMVKYRPYLSDAEYKQMVDIQIATAAGNDKVGKQLLGDRSTDQIIDQTASTVGIFASRGGKNASAGEKYNAYRGQVTSEIANFVQMNNRQPKNDEVQKIVDNLLIENKGGMFSGGKYGGKRRFEVPSDQAFTADVGSVSDIPKAYQDWIRGSNRFKANPSEQNMLTIFKMLVNKNGK